MKRFLARLLLFLIFIPALVLIIFKFNFWNFFILNLLYVLFAFLGAMEARGFFRREGRLPSPLLALLGAGFPALAYLEAVLSSSVPFTEIFLITALIGLFIKTAFFDTGKDFSNLYPNLTAGLVVLFYPGLFLSYMVRLQEFANPSLLTALLIGLVFGNDIFAYLGGRFLGSRTRLNLEISPNKSLVGFLAGVLFSVAFILFFHYFTSGLFGVPVVFIIFLGGLLAGMTILGDLLESAFKRASGLKDSGRLMLGRGGVLDSIDSLLLCAPVLYYLYPLVAGQN